MNRRKFLRWLGTGAAIGAAASALPLEEVLAFGSKKYFDMGNLKGQTFRVGTILPVKFPQRFDVLYGFGILSNASCRVRITNDSEEGAMELFVQQVPLFAPVDMVEIGGV